jgi:hypothetical protein
MGFGASGIAAGVEGACGECGQATKSAVAAQRMTAERIGGVIGGIRRIGLHEVGAR